MRGQKKLSPRQEAALVALLAEPTYSAAAARARVAEATLYRWLKLPAFQAAYRDLRRQAVEGAVAHLQQATAKAVEALCRGLTCGTPAAEIRAARVVIDQAAKWTELIDLTERVEDLERQTGIAPEGPPS
jgi:hypothetical protein